MKNLFKDTVESLKNIDKTFNDVICICGDDFKISKEDFYKLANKDAIETFSQVIASDLKIIGKDFIMKRFFKNGEEGWVSICLSRNSQLIKEYVQSLPLKKISTLMNFSEKSMTLKSLN